MNFSFETQFEKNPDLPWKLIENEAILIHLEEGELLRLNEVGAEIWKALDGRPLSEMVAHIQETFAVSRGKAEKDTLSFVKQLLQEELIQIRKEPIQNKGGQLQNERVRETAQ